MTDAIRTAASLDASDPLRRFRDRFHLPAGPEGAPAIYLCGNSLGPMPKAAAEEISEVLSQWSTLGVRGREEIGRAHV